MAVNIRDFNFTPTDNETINIVLQELQLTLFDFKVAIINIDKRIIALEEEG